MTGNLIITLTAAGISAALFGLVVHGQYETRKARKRLMGGSGASAPQTSMVESALRPLFSLYAPLLTRVRLPKQRALLDRKFAYAALEGYTHEEFWAFQLLMVVIVALIPYVLTLELALFNLEYTVPWWLYPFAAVAGFYMPSLWLNSLITRRRTGIVLAFPHFVANLTLTVEAGLDFIAATNRIVRTMKISPLKEELNRVLSEIQLGSTRAAALRNMNTRVGAPELATFVMVLIQADRLGTSIGKALRAQAERLRRERFEAAERKGALASQKLLFPLIFFIMPAVFIIIFGPLIVRVVTEGLQGLMV